MPSLCYVAGIHEGNNPYDQLTSKKTSTGNESYPSAGVDPSGNPAEKGNPSLPTDDGYPMILS